VASYNLYIKPSAAKEIEAIPTRKDRRRVVEKIRSLADDPRPAGCRKLSGADRYRIRVGRYRILYSIEDDRLIVMVVKVADRKDVYRRRS
jgi:mRNA interferase RelE/StbE